MRVPHSDVTPVKVPDGLSDEQVLFLGDIFPTGWQAAAACEIEPTDTVAVWGAGPVGQFAVRSAVMLGAEQVVCIDHMEDRLSSWPAHWAGSALRWVRPNWRCRARWHAPAG